MIKIDQKYYINYYDKINHKGSLGLSIRFLFFDRIYTLFVIGLYRSKKFINYFDVEKIPYAFTINISLCNIFFEFCLFTKGRGKTPLRIYKDCLFEAFLLGFGAVILPLLLVILIY